MRVLSRVVLGAFIFAAAAQGAAAADSGIASNDPFSVGGIKVDATAPSPNAARDLAMKQGLSQAWKTLFRRLASEPASGTEPQLSERELMSLILRSEAGNERRNTTRYVADMTFHFNPSAVRQLMRRSNVLADSVMNAAANEPLPPPENPGTHLAVTVRFETAEEWTRLRSRLDATKVVNGIDVVGLMPQEAQIYLGYSGDVGQLQAALAQHALELTSTEDEYTLELGALSTATASLQ